MIPSKSWRRGAENGLAMYFAWRRTTVHTQHWHWLHLGRGAEADLWVPGDGTTEAEMEETGKRSGMNWDGLPKNGLDGEANLTRLMLHWEWRGLSEWVWMHTQIMLRCYCNPPGNIIGYWPACPDDQRTTHLQGSCMPCQHHHCIQEHVSETESKSFLFFFFLTLIKKLSISQSTSQSILADCNITWLMFSTEMVQDFCPGLTRHQTQCCVLSSARQAGKLDWIPRQP